MTSDAVRAEAAAIAARRPAQQAAVWHPHIARPRRVVAAAIGLGAIGHVLFFGVGLGVNFPLAMALLLLGGWLVRRRTPGLGEVDPWLAPAALAFASFAAIRADPTIVGLDVLTSLAIAGAALAAWGGTRVAERSFGGVVGVVCRAVGWAAAGAVAALAAARRTLGAGPSLTGTGRRALPIAQGIAVAIPIVLVFLALFSAADAVFANVVGEALAFEVDLGDIPIRLLMIVALAWVAAGGLGLAAADAGDAPASAETPPRRRRGTTEAVIVLLAVDAVFVLFVALQAAYLFGGLDTLGATGLTYAEYARRGFFELVIVAVLAGGIVIGAERSTRSRSQLLLGAAICLVLLTGIVLASAALRLRLYQEAYGWTELRLYVLATICLLAIAGIALFVQLATNRVRWFGHAFIAAALAIGLGLNVLGPARFITEQNVTRVLGPSLVPANGRSGLDDVYALSLGDDAIPDLVRALPRLEPARRRSLADALDARLAELRSDAGLSAWQAWNAGRSAARDALEAGDRRGELP